ncbi:MAG: primosomal protein N' [Acidobacteriota bacterium]
MPQGLAEFAEVAVPLGVYETFTYAIPAALRNDIRLGSRVEVPLGRKLTTAFVTALVDESSVAPAKIRAIRSLLDEEEPALIPDIIELCRWASNYYLAPFGEMLRVALPANMASRGKRSVSFVGTGDTVQEAVDSGRILMEDLPLLEQIRKREFTVSSLLQHEQNARGTMRRLSDAGIIAITESFRDSVGVRYDRFVVLENPMAELPRKQQEALDILAARGGELTWRALMAAGAGESSIGTLVRKGAVRVERRPRQHTLDAFLAEPGDGALQEFSYSSEQAGAIAAISSSIGSFAAFLLEGVTGSGKTEVYVELMREVVRRGQQAILLVPEISLTPVFAARLKERFGDRIAILHSNLTASERYDQWWRARRGLVDVAIGPRSALFTPFQRLGIIVVDEEGDSAYKQEETPRYNARDLAVVRARIANIPIILGSATPSLESRYNAERTKYRLLRLQNRVESRPLPEVEIIDIRRERGEKEDRGLIIFSERLREEMARVFGSGEQAIVLMNRRGYAPYLLCRQCENDFRCRDCSVTMTVHRSDGLLICHYCGYRRKIPSRCPLCEGEVLQPIGFGTEKVLERFRRYFPGVAVEVLDRDSTRRKGSLVQILDRFRRRETQALIGTQMISKGHHFPNVTLTAVINADAILGYPDFRSAEKTFYLLTQVAGRAGRGELSGRVVIQSAFPNHYALQHALNHDYESFYRAEIQFRRTFHYPPVTSMIAIILRGADLSRVENAAVKTADLLEKALGTMNGVRIQGPASAPLARIKGVHRFQILVRSSNRAHIRSAVESAVLGRKWAGVDVVIDVDPINLL